MGLVLLQETFYAKLVSLLWIGACFESWVNFLGPPLFTSIFLRGL